MIHPFTEDGFKSWSIQWSRCLGLLGGVAILLLIYASLIPLEYQPLDWNQSLDRWSKIPWFKLGIYSRADWIANGLVVVPVAFLLTGAFTYRKSPLRVLDGLIDIFATALVLAFLFLLVFGIELVQIWFPPRTVSWNDIVAGWIGALVGVVFWVVCGKRLLDAAEFFIGIRRFEDRLLAFALLTCVVGFVYSLYPLDIILSHAEWSEKIRLGRVHWGLTAHSNSNLEWAQGLIVSALQMIPFGVLGLRLPSMRSRWAWVLVCGLLLELIQLPIFSKFSSPADVVSGWIGGALGLLGVQSKGIWYWIGRQRWLWIGVTVAWSGILIAAFLARFEGWVEDPRYLQKRWSDFFTYPFLRYYFTSEYSALMNLLGKLLSFGALGALTTGCLMFGQRSSHQETYRTSLFSSLLICLPIGGAIEIFQIYLLPFIGDLSDIGVYLVGTIGGGWMMMFLVRGIAIDASSFEVPVCMEATVDGQRASKLHQLHVGTTWLSKAVGVAILIFGGIVAGLHPGWPFVQMLLLVIVASIVYCLPRWFPGIFILSLVAGDAYPLTGQLVLQEYDSCLLGVVAGWFLSWVPNRNPNNDERISEGFRQLSKADPVLFVGLVSLAVSGAISMMIGLIRLPSAPWGDQLSVYFTQWNAIRVGKGLFWGLIFSTMVMLSVLRLPRLGRRVWDLAFLRGCSLAGAYVVGFVVFERALFPGILNWSDVYRATGPFFTMHIGDQHLDAFLVLVFPWVWANALYPQCTRAERFYCAIVLGLLAYASFSTMPRATFAVMLVQIGLLIPWTWLVRARRLVRWSFGMAAYGLGCFLVVGLVLGMQTQAIQDRFSMISQDWNGRVAHWSMILRRGSSGVGGLSIGHGIGTLPSLVASELGRPVPPLSWNRIEEGGGHRGQVHFRGQWPIYLERCLRDDLDKSLDGLGLQFKRFGVKEPQQQGPLELQSILVEKSMLTFFSVNGLAVSEAQEVWAPLDLKSLKDFEDGSLAQGNSITGWRPRSIGLSVLGRGDLMIQSRVESGPTGISSISSYPWFFTCDDHMVWGAKNFLVHAYYEQGLIGVIAWVLLLFSGLWRGLWGHSLLDRSLAIAIVGFLGVGFFGTLIDTPWLTAMLLGMLGARSYKFQDWEYAKGGSEDGTSVSPVAIAGEV